jgi:hypothetical protein
MALTPPRSQEGRSCPICYRPGNEEGAGTCLPTAAVFGSAATWGSSDARSVSLFYPRWRLAWCPSTLMAIEKLKRSFVDAPLFTKTSLRRLLFCGALNLFMFFFFLLSLLRAP